MEGAIRVLIADDQSLMRAALRLCLEPEPDIEVVGEASDGGQAVDLARRLRPDVVLMDLRMPEVDGIQATRRLAGPGVEQSVRVLAITGFDLDENILAALRAGASGFLVKDATADQIVHAVRVVAAGEALLSPSVTRRLLDAYVRFLPVTAPLDSVAGLTPRELTVLRLVARGWGNTQIARSLHLAPSTVKSHVAHLLAKLGVPDRVHLVIYAYETGLVAPLGTVGGDA